MAKRLTAQLCLQTQAPVKARVKALQSFIDKLLVEAQLAYKKRDTVSFQAIVREIVLAESEHDLLDLTSYSLAKLYKDAAAFGPPSNIVPSTVAQNIGVVIFASDLYRNIPDLVAFRKSVFCHYALNEATCLPSVLPGCGIGPGEDKILHNIVIPKTLVELFDPRFKPPIAESVRKRQEKLIESYGIRSVPPAPSTQMRTTASPFPQIPTQQRAAPSPFPSIPPQQGGGQAAASPFPQVPTGMHSTGGLYSTGSPSAAMRNTGGGQRYSTPPQPHPHPPSQSQAARRSAAISQFPSVPQGNDAFPSVPAAPAPRPPHPKEEPVYRSQRDHEEPRLPPQREPAPREPSPTDHSVEHGRNDSFFGKIKKAFGHSKKEDSSSSSCSSQTGSGQSTPLSGSAAEPTRPPPTPEVKAEPAEPTPENGDVVSLSNSDVEISPQTLTFGLSSRQAPVDSPLTENLVVKNKHKQTIIVLLEHAKDPSTDLKYELSFSHPVSFALKSGAEENLVATLKILCTTKLEFNISIKTWKEGGRKYKDARLPFATESQLTTKLDPDELKEDEMIGEGAYGTVYSGRYRGMDVAIKKLKHQEYLTPDMKADFASEVGMMEKLRHNAILNFVGAVHIPGHLCIVTELCPYGSFLSSMKKYPSDFNEALRVKTLLDASNGMDFLHQSGIIHRDLKPDNLLMVSLEPRSSVVAKLSDFGTTRDVNCFAAQMQSTKGVGTPLFMAPEIFSGKPYDKSVDLYSFSLIIYVAFATQLPFEGDPIANTPWGYADAIKSGKRPGVPPTCPPEIADMMKKCWDGDPAKRPSFEDVHLFFRKYYKDHYFS